jgi:hypothetical protein
MAACSSSKSRTSASLSVAEGSADLSAVVNFGEQTRNHVDTPVSYPQSPPTGGDHAPAWQNCGVYDEPVPNELAVHSMEHGAVWITYQPDLADADKRTLEATASGQTHILVSPFPGLSAPIVLNAWSTQLSIDSVDDPRVELFIETYQRGPQTPEPGAPCSGAIGSPN